MIEVIILEYWYIWCVIVYCFMFVIRKCKNDVIVYRIVKIKGKGLIKYGYKFLDLW